MRFDLSDEDWALLEPLLPKSRKSARINDRKIMNAIFYVLRTGMPWRDLPARYCKIEGVRISACCGQYRSRRAVTPDRAELLHKIADVWESEPGDEADCERGARASKILTNDATPLGKPWDANSTSSPAGVGYLGTQRRPSRKRREHGRV